MTNNKKFPHKINLISESEKLKLEFQTELTLKLLFIIIFTIIIVFYFHQENIYLNIILVSLAWSVFFINTKKLWISRRSYKCKTNTLSFLKDQEGELDFFIKTTKNIHKISKKMNELSERKNEVDDIYSRELFNYYIVQLHKLKNDLNAGIERENERRNIEKNKKNLDKEVGLQAEKILKYTDSKISQHPLVITKHRIISLLSMLIESKRNIEKQWDIYINKASWWEQLNADYPNYKEIDKNILKLSSMRDLFDIRHGKDLEKLTKYYESKKEISLSRLSRSYRNTLIMLDNNKNLAGSSDSQLRYALWGGILGMSASVANDFYDAHELYDSLRGVHGGFSEMSDSDIWWETLWMGQDSLAGLASLAKGAYFEKLVAEDTGGQLFEHFNHKGTDIIIDGEAIQLKATDSVAYINSVDDDIPVISTSEVADRTDAIDSGISNLDISETTMLALGGTVTDTGDIVVDGMLGGLAGLGFFSTMKGLEHFVDECEKGNDRTDALAHGLGIAIEGTFKGIVDTGELLWNVASSKPVRVAGTVALAGGKGLVWILKKIDKKLSGQ